ncbi:hypothetical protein, unlikely [Trypanosoma brucei gambiense DAL972]|uniref:Uncharacterized protein n=1 Tax=Trypanosoma brucei gambiense (strain MHOM/CI/86/DAL972) TaxID=679716 RepID=D0A776_TRYB9|nr:hypothetical protein, unlikely [Trypanosoma brucei gambiense DAL972]CBH17527.1 hypothetical protein, unlikely [Trypanosoma brucei gambiense DAL972]|eukprot:XP_011779791.1 hypothetical protein, unlikely [Trypanosoma brucei gambiense DAL972]
MADRLWLHAHLCWRSTGAKVIFFFPAVQFSERFIMTEESFHHVTCWRKCHLKISKKKKKEIDIKKKVGSFFLRNGVMRLLLRNRRGSLSLCAVFRTEKNIPIIQFFFFCSTLKIVFFSLMILKPTIAAY